MMFLLLQGLHVLSWALINVELWLMCFSRVQTHNQSLTPKNTVSSQSPTCLDFSKGTCRWLVCRYRHICSIYYSSTYGCWACSADQGDLPIQNRAIGLNDDEVPFVGHKTDDNFVSEPGTLHREGIQLIALLSPLSLRLLILSRSKVN